MFEHSVRILLVDDDDVDVRVVKRAFEKHGLKNSITVAHDGIDALAKLRGEGDTPPLEQPLLVLLDLNMPRMSGLDFLTELRSDPKLSRTIVFVLTTSNDERDRMAAYDQHISGYLLKCETGRDLKNYIPMIERFLATVKFPEENGYAWASRNSQPANL